MFAFFDEKSDHTVKERMAASLLQTPRRVKFSPGKPAFPKELVEESENLQPYSLIGPNSWLLFELLHMDGNWLSLPSQQWAENEEFLQMANIVKNISVVNDAAERGVKDIQDFAECARDSFTRERMVLVSSSHRAKLPQFLKKDMDKIM